MADFLFDIGKVLLDFDFESSLSKLLPPDRASSSLATLLAKKDDFEAGLIHVDDYTEWAISTLDTDATPEQFHHAWRNIFTPNPPMWEVVRTLVGQGHRLILFSNTNAIHCPWIFETFPEFSLFHASVLSFEVNAIKPQPEIYQYAMDKFSLVPENTLYIDDLPANIHTGRLFGFKSHQYDINNHHNFQLWLSDVIASINP